MSNIVKFPKENPRANLPPEEMKEDLDARRKKYVDGLVDNVATNLARIMSVVGVNPKKDRFSEDFMYAVESIRSTMYRNYDIKHPLQDYIDQCQLLHDQLTQQKESEIQHDTCGLQSGDDICANTNGAA